MQTEEFNMAVQGNLDVWVPACGGTEQPFKARSGARLMYCFNPKQRRHAYYCLDTDLILDDGDANLHMWSGPSVISWIQQCEARKS